MSSELTRGRFLTRGAALAGATATLTSFGPATMKAAAAGGNVDLQVAQFALLLERLEADFYVRALDKVSFSSSSVRSLVSTLADDERQHVDAVEQLVRQLAGRAGRAPRFDFGRALGSQEDFLRTAQTLEDTGVSAYNGAGPLIQNDEILETAGQIVQVESRHAARVRQENKAQPAPRAFDRPLTMDEVMARIKPYIAGS